MAWTSPKTWLSAVLSSAELNTHLRDNLLHIAGTSGTNLTDFNHNHQNAAGGGTLNHNTATDNPSQAVHGLPTNVGVLGHRDGGGRYMQGANGGNAGAVSTQNFDVSGPTSITFPVAFGAVPTVVATANVPGGAAGVSSVSTSGFTTRVVGYQTTNAGITYLAVGT